MYKFDTFKGLKSMTTSKKILTNETDEMEKLKNKLTDLNHQRRHALQNDTVGYSGEYENYNNSKSNTVKTIAALKKKEN